MTKYLLNNDSDNRNTGFCHRSIVSRQSPNTIAVIWQHINFFDGFKNFR